MSGASSASLLVRRNKQVFRKHFPAVHVQLARLPQTMSVPELDSSGRLQNIRVDSVTIYPGPAEDWTAGQLRGYFANPPRVIFQDLYHCNLTSDTTDFGHKLMEQSARKKLGPYHPEPQIDSGFAFIFGVGLGYHLETLIERLDVRHLILIEPICEFLLHSFSAIDWSVLVKKASKKKMKIHFVTDPTPETAAHSVEKLIMNLGNTFIDGSYFYYHYYSWVLVETNSILSITLRHHFYTTGFFSDECVMMRNAIGNMNSHDFAICENKPMLQRDDSPVFVVASGPSLDNDLEVIRRWRDKVVLISCGTTISILLKNGIRPDIHVEVENGPRTPEQLGKARELYGFHGIIFCGSMTVRPEVPAMFDEAWLYFRGALTPSQILRGSHQILIGSDPTVANGGAAVALASGFKEIYLFGVDCGKKVGSDKHHSQESIYYNDKDFHLKLKDNEYTKEWPGNFGGTFHANYVLDMSARTMAETRRGFRRANVYNCSDGVRMEGIQPKMSAAIDLSQVKSNPKQAISGIRDQMIRYKAGEMTAPIDNVAMIEGTHLYFDAVTEFFNNAPGKFRCFHDLMNAFTALEQSLPQDKVQGIITMLSSTIATMVRVTAYYGCRLSSPAQQRALMRIGVRMIPGVLEPLRETALEIFQSIRPLPVPENASPDAASEAGLSGDAAAAEA